MSIIVTALMLCSINSPDYNLQKSKDRGVPICNRNVSSSTKTYIYKRDHIYNREGYCINHIIPLAIGGSNHNDNLEAMRLNNEGKCSSPNETEAIWCFLNKDCSQEEAISFLIAGME